MKKFLVLFLMLGALFATAKTKVWQINNYTITTDTYIQAPYIDSSLYIKSKIATASVSLKGEPITIENNNEFYPLIFYYGEIVSINHTVNNEMTVIWYKAE